MYSSNFFFISSYHVIFFVAICIASLADKILAFGPSPYKMLPNGTRTRYWALHIGSSPMIRLRSLLRNLELIAPLSADDETTTSETPLVPLCGPTITADSGPRLGATKLTSVVVPLRNLCLL